MSERPVLAGRVLGFAALPLLATLTPFFVLPVVSRASTTGEWSALAVGQSVGLLASLFVGYGWNVVGPPRVAQSAPDRRPELYRESLESRMRVLLVAGPAVLVLGWVFAPAGGSARELCALMGVAQSLSGLSIAWYCIGIGSPRTIAAYEVAPRAAGAVLAAFLVLLTHWPWWYPLAILVSVVAGVGAFSWRTLRGGDADTGRRSPAEVIRTQTAPTLIEASAGSYTMGGGFLANLATGVQQMATYGSGDRLNQVALQSIAAVGNALSPWVSEVSGPAFVRRARLASLAHAALGVLGLVGIALWGPWASGILFGQRFSVPTSTCLAFGFYFCFVSFQTVLARHILVSRGRLRIVLAATLSGAAVGIPAVVVGAASHGATGAASGLALGEGLICLILLAPAWRAVRAEAEQPGGPLPGNA